MVRSASDPSALQKSMYGAVYAADKDQPLTEVKTLEQLKSESTASDRVLSVLFAIFGGVALLLAAIGIHGRSRMRGARCLLHPRAAGDKGGPYHSPAL